MNSFAKLKDEINFNSFFQGEYFLSCTGLRSHFLYKILLGEIMLEV